jgi:hypothetical protein
MTQVNFRFGSVAPETDYLGDVRFPLDSDRTADIARGPFCADFVAKGFLGWGTEIFRANVSRA